VADQSLGMSCRTGCGACCIALSITTALPNMPLGKPAGVVCVNLDQNSMRCRIWGTAEYPLTCRRFRPEPDVCGGSRTEAMELIRVLELHTAG
jgi:Fe-S-cluster containining protein